MLSNGGEATEVAEAWVAAEMAGRAAARAEAILLTTLQALCESRSALVLLTAEREMLRRQLTAAKDVRSRGELEAALRRIDQALGWLERMGNAIEGERAMREVEAAAKRVRECVRRQRLWQERMGAGEDERLARLTAARVANLRLAEELCLEKEREAVRAQRGRRADRGLGR